MSSRGPASKSYRPRNLHIKLFRMPTVITHQWMRRSIEQSANATLSNPSKIVSFHVSSLDIAAEVCAPDKVIGDQHLGAQISALAVLRVCKKRSSLRQEALHLAKDARMIG